MVPIYPLLGDAKGPSIDDMKRHDNDMWQPLLLWYVSSPKRSVDSNEITRKTSAEDTLHNNYDLVLRSFRREPDIRTTTTHLDDGDDDAAAGERPALRDAEDLLRGRERERERRPPEQLGREERVTAISDLYRRSLKGEEGRKEGWSRSAGRIKTKFKPASL